MTGGSSSLGARAQEWLDGGGFFEWRSREASPSSPPMQIFHRELGDPAAPVLLLVHGFPTCSIDWFDVVGPLSEHRRVCLLDFPGFGFSDKPKGAQYTLGRDAELLDHYLREVVGAEQGAIAAHDRGDSVALAFLDRCTTGASSFEITNLIISNANVFLPLSNLTDFQRLVLDPATAPMVLDAITPEALAVGMGDATFTPRRGLDDPAIRALADTFAANDGTAVLHDTIQYLVERSEHETEWLEVLAASTVPTTLVWGLCDTVSPVRVANHVWVNHLAHKPGENHFWILPRANHYLQHDQPDELVRVLSAALSGDAAPGPGPTSDEPGAPVFVDRSVPTLLPAREVLAGRPDGTP